MARFQNIVNINNLTDTEIADLQPGQWVFAGTDTPASRGKFWGVKKSGTVVVAWQGNTHNRNWTEYQTALRNYANA